MRRNFVLVTVLAIMFVASITLAAKNGAVKSPLVSGAPNGQPGGGWVNMNINAKGVLIVTIHLDVPGEPGAVQNILVGTPFGVSDIVPGFMTLNAAGKGTKQIKVQLELTGLDDEEAIKVWVDTDGDAGYFITDPFPVSVPVPKVK